MIRGGEAASSRMLPTSICGGKMIRLDLSYFYRLGAEFSDFRKQPGDVPLTNAWIALMRLRDRISGIANDTTLTHTLRGCEIPARTLVDKLNAILMRDISTGSYTSYDQGEILTALYNFEIVLTSQMTVADAYLVTGKRGLDTLKLATEGEVLFSPDLPHKVPQALPDAREVGKCLAFEVPTAAAFHILRTVETVVRRYWDIATNLADRPKQQNLGVYLNELANHGGADEKIIAALKQIKDLYRNVIMHPEVHMDLNEAISLFGIASSAIDAMLRHIPMPPPPAQHGLLGDAADDEIVLLDD